MTVVNPANTDYRFYSVRTPQIFKEFRLPADEQDWTPGERRKFEHLEDLAERHGACIEINSYRIG